MTVNNFPGAICGGIEITIGLVQMHVEVTGLFIQPLQEFPETLFFLHINQKNTNSRPEKVKEYGPDMAEYLIPPFKKQGYSPAG